MTDRLAGPQQAQVHVATGRTARDERRARPTPLAAAACVIGVAVLSVACATTAQGPFVWVDQLKEPEVAVPVGEYLIGPGDALNVQVWEQEKMSAHVRVRSDGQISLPFLNDVPAAGKTPVSLAHDLEESFKKFIREPQVTVAVDEATPLKVSVLGEVAEPGLHSLDPGAGVAQALAAAGGLKEYAHKDRIFVLRQGANPPQRIRMTYESVTGAQGRAATLRLRSGDVVVVE